MLPVPTKGCPPLRLSPQCPLRPLCVPTALSRLWTYQLLSGLLMATVAVGIVALLAVKVWPR